MAYLYAVGQEVRYVASIHNRLASPSPYKIVRRLPVDGDEHRYRIKCSTENFERVVRESELERLR